MSTHNSPSKKRGREPKIQNSSNGSSTQPTRGYKRAGVNSNNSKTRKKRRERSASSSSVDLETVLYIKDAFVTCRSPGDSFFLCQILQHVYEDTAQIRIRWCSRIDGSYDEKKIDENTHFKFDYEDILDIDAILMEIKHVIWHSDETLTLRKKDIHATKRLLQESISKTSANSDQAKKKRRRRSSNEQESKPTTASSMQTNRAISQYEVDPFFEDSVSVPFISSSVQSKLAIRAVVLNDARLLQSLIEDVDHVCSVHIRRDLPNSLTAIHYAIKLENIDLLRLLLNDLKEPKKDRCSFPEVTIREGKNALNQDTYQPLQWNDRNSILAYAMKINCSRAIYDLLCEDFLESDRYSNLALCLRAGHRKLAASLILDMHSKNNEQFSQLHYQVLVFNEENLSINRASDVVVASEAYGRITPIHCAAINPNSKYLQQLLAIVSEPHLADGSQRRPIHFAAVCEGTGPIEYLLSNVVRNVNLNETDEQGNTPLHLAVKYGRVRNAEVILRVAKERAESNDPEEQAIFDKFGLASIDRRNRSEHCPLDLAIQNNHLDCLRVLLDYGASASKTSLLISACQRGDLNLVSYLTEHGARLESRDRFQRTPLIQACLYGHAHVVSYLLRRGASVHMLDSSMNSALHYAIAYGWYFCVRLLVEAGANSEQATCLIAGLSKGHHGICDYLLTEQHFDINSQTDEGATVVMLIVQSDICAASIRQLEYVVREHQADCTCSDINGQNALHYLALNRSIQSGKYAFTLAEILFEQKCYPLQMDNQARTPLMSAIQSKNSMLVDFFLQRAKFQLTIDVDHQGKTYLHHFANNCDDHQLMDLFIHLPVTDDLKAMGQIFDQEGRTPFHYCLIRFDELCQRNQFSKAIGNMIRFCLERLECDPDVEMKYENNPNIFYLLRSCASFSNGIEHPLEFFLSKTKNINIIHRQTHRTPLLEAIDRQETSLVHLLLQQPSCDLLVRDAEHNQALHCYLASSHRSDGYIETFRLFMEKLECLNPGALNCLPLHIAVNHNLGLIDSSTEIERTLIQRDKHLFVQDDLGNLPLHYVFLNKQVGDDPVQLCILIIQAMNYQSLDTKNKRGSTPLSLAVEKGSTICVMLLFKHQASLVMEDNLSNSAIAISIASNHLNLFTTLLHLPVDIDLSKSYTPPSQANASVAMPATKLWRWKYAIDSQPNRHELATRQSLIYLIIQQNWQGVLSVVLDDFHRFHLSFLQVFEAAILNERWKFALHLFSSIANRAILHETNSNGENIYFLLAKTRLADPEVSEKILGVLHENEVQWNVHDKHGFYPLHYACVHHNKHLLTFLRRKYSSQLDFNQKDPFGNTASGLIFWSLTMATSFDKDDLRMLIQSGTSLDCLCNYENEIAMDPLSFGRINPSVAYSCPYPPMNANSLRTSPLINAIVHNHFELAQFLLQLGADVNFPDEEQRTPLMHAIRQNNLDIVKLLLDQSCSHLLRITLKTDRHGWTSIHHLVQPFPECSYTNSLELIELLHESGASLTKKDQMDLSPAQYALRNGSKHLYDKIQELIAEEKTDSILSVAEHFDVHDPNQHLLNPPDFRTDAQQLIDQYISTHSSSVPVDPLSKMNQTGNVLIDIEKNEPYDVRLTMIDIDDNLTSFYNFFRMQMIEHKSETKLYLLFTRWGRMGEGAGRYRSTPFSSFEECRTKFCEIFHEKTGSSWDASIQSSEGQLHRAVDVPIDFTRLQDDTQHPPSQLQSVACQTFFRTLFNPDAIRIDLKKSQLKPSLLQQAYEILKQLQVEINQRDQLKLTIEQTRDDTQKGKYKQILNSICKLTNDYYNLIPLQGYDNEELPILDNEHLIKAQENKLADLAELELSYKIFLAAQANQNQISPLDYLYRSMNCQFEAMNPNDLDSQLILRYIWTSSPDTRVEQIFKIARLEKENLQNHVLLWHGTNVCSLISVLARGFSGRSLYATTTTETLPEKEIHMSDVFAKSLEHCSAVRQDGVQRCFMLLCQVPLDNVPLNSSQNESCGVPGYRIPDPRYTITRKYGAQMPLGSLINNTSVSSHQSMSNYNEYIFHNESPIVIRYLVQFRR